MKKIILFILFTFILCVFNISHANYNIWAEKIDKFFNQLYDKKPNLYKKVVEQKSDIIEKLVKNIDEINIYQYIIKKIYSRDVFVSNNEIIFNRFAFQDDLYTEDIKNKIREELIKKIINLNPNLINSNTLSNIKIDLVDDKEGKIDITYINDKKRDLDDIDKLIKNIHKWEFVNWFYNKVSKYRYVNSYYKVLTSKELEKDIKVNFNINDIKNIQLKPNDIKTHFELVSFRTRFVWNEKYYRQFNINELYKNISDNWLIILQPKGVLNFDQLVKKWDDWYSKYKYWLAIVDKKEISVYWGGLCWAATWLYQWVLYNKDIKVSWRNHSMYSWLYNANINWEDSRIPWLDKTYYWEDLNVLFENISNTPIIMWNTLDFAWYEKNFTLWVKWRDNKSTVTYISSYNQNNYNCYTWDINWEKRSMCYKTRKQLDKEIALRELNTSLKNKKISTEDYNIKLKEIEKKFSQ